MSAASRPPIPARVGALDGLRGWAALGVLIYHLSWEMFGIIYPVFRSYLAAIPTGGGALALCTFFCTSGYLLTIRRWHVSDDKRLLVQMLKRYVRLTIPILGSVLMFYAVLVLQVSYSNPAADILDRGAWLGKFGDVKPVFVDALTFGLYRVHLLDRAHNYGPFLWTMAAQLLGSFLVLPIAYGHRLLREQYSALFLIIAVLMFAYPPAAAMPIGALIALLQRDGLLFRKPADRLESTLATLVFIGAVLVSSAVVDWGSNGQIIHAVLSGVVVITAIRSRPLDYIFTLPVSKFLSKISFPIYLVQAALIISFSSWLVVQASAADMLNEWTALAIVAASIVVTLVVSWAFLPIEHFATWVVKWLDRLNRKPKPAVTAPS